MRIGNVELLEAVTAYFEVFQVGRRSDCETAAELYEWVLRGRSLLSLCEISQHTDLKRRGVIRSRNRLCWALVYIPLPQKIQQGFCPSPDDCPEQCYV
jgi:hypothetical protein